MVLYIDHYESFSSTIVDYITYLGCQVSMLKTDDQIDNIDQYSHIIIG
ncbi:aminodeoxychorismate/anthranilate synthase component II, partial [Francisella tularensis subsp. holarctica]|nr:aminodeoxychorismate/anthranilate synthase component II [Francisella tularensis subsp. holarctica]